VLLTVTIKCNSQDLTRADIIKLIAVATEPLNLEGVNLTGVDLKKLDLTRAAPKKERRVNDRLKI
jgi:hypothetical protein